MDLHDIMTRINWLVICNSRLGTEILEILDEAMNYQFSSIETMTPVLHRHSEDAVHMMLAAPRLHYYLCGTEPMFVI